MIVMCGRVRLLVPIVYRYRRRDVVTGPGGRRVRLVEIAEFSRNRPT